MIKRPTTSLFSSATSSSNLSIFVSSVCFFFLKAFTSFFSLFNFPDNVINCPSNLVLSSLRLSVTSVMNRNCFCALPNICLPRGFVLDDKPSSRTCVIAFEALRQFFGSSSASTKIEKKSLELLLSCWRTERKPVPLVCPPVVIFQHIVYSNLEKSIVIEICISF